MGKSQFMFLRGGQRYRVLRDFRDYDGLLHPAGERWTFLWYSFLPYDDGLSLFVAKDGPGETQIRLQWKPEAQGRIVDNLADYVGETQE